jgi:hypothetical protein
LISWHESANNVPGNNPAINNNVTLSKALGYPFHQLRFAVAYVAFLFKAIYDLALVSFSLVSHLAGLYKHFFGEGKHWSSPTSLGIY